MHLSTGTILAFVLVAYSIILHEIAHGAAALWYGDPTAKRLGRLTLNPVSHIDPMGTIIFPLLQLLTAGHVFLGWARPVPVNPLLLRPRTRGDIVVSLAGIVVNLGLAVLFAIALGLLGFDPWQLQLTGIPADSELHRALWWAMFANLGLAVFNLLPIPPLDGSHVMKYLLPPDLRASYERVGFYGIWILLALIVSGLLDSIMVPPLLALLRYGMDLAMAINRWVHGGP